MRASGPRPATPDSVGPHHSSPVIGNVRTNVPANLASSPASKSSAAFSDADTLEADSPVVAPLSSPSRVPPEPSTPAVASSNPQSDTTYYTASWGSPYDRHLPPAGRHLARQNHRYVSSAASLEEFDEESPNVQFGLSHLIPSRLTTNYNVTPTRPSTPNIVDPLEETPKSSAFGGLESGLAAFPKNLIAQFNRFRQSTQLSEGPDDQGISKGHPSRLQNRSLQKEEVLRPGRRTSSMESSRYATPRKPKGEPTSPIMSQSPAGLSATLMSPRLAERTSSATSRNGKKRVAYKGKTCWIALPPDTARGGEGQAPIPLTVEEVRQRMMQWERLGYDTRGFGHWRFSPDHGVSDHSQTSGLFLDPMQKVDEEQQSPSRVKIPNKKVWDDYVQQVTEEKLRALGVSLGGESDSGPPSRSSQFSPISNPFSPPLPSSSAGSHRMGSIPNVYPAGFVPGSSNHNSTRSIASPISAMGHPRAPTHMHRQSMFASPISQHSVSPTGFMSWSPQPYMHPHGVPPSTSPPGSSNIRSPISPLGVVLESAPFPMAPRGELLAQMQRQQQVAKPQQPTPPPQSASALSGVAENDTEEELQSSQTQSAPPEMFNPKPGHRHNISAKLEETLSKSDYAFHPSTATVDTVPEKGGEVTPTESLAQHADADKEDQQKTTLDQPASSKQTDAAENQPAAVAPASKLNVEAKEFNPRASAGAFMSNMFAPSTLSLHPAKAKPSVPKSTVAPKANPTTSSFNVNAPAFNPSGFGGAGFAKSEFSFDRKAPSLKPTAPVFEPSGPRIFSEQSFSSFASDSSSRMISDASSAVLKPARDSRAPPMGLPRHQHNKSRELRDDEDGRLMQGNTKRAKAFDDDGNDVPQFAPSDLPIDTGVLKTALPEIGNADLAESPAAESAADDDSPAAGTNEMSTTLVMEEDELAAGAGQSDKERTPVPPSRDTTEQVVREIPMTDLASAPGSPQTPVGAQPILENLKQNAPASLPDLITSRVTSAGSTLSALATPFEPDAEPVSPVTPDLPSHITIGRSIAEALLSPPSSSTAFRSDPDIPVQQIKRPVSSPPMSSPPESRLPASVRYYDDLEQPSFQEIDAVMQHFNVEGSDFGVEKDARSWSENSPNSPREEVPAVLQAPPAFHVPLRSDAPSPSPRRALLQPIHRGGDSASVSHDPFSDRAVAGYESPMPRAEDRQISEWDEFSTGDEEKILSRGRFFDSHVSTLIRDALGARLDPLSKDVQSIQDAITAMSTLRSTRPASSRAAIDDSDADDEEDDEPEFPSRAWSRSPMRDRKLERIKIAVQEALASHRRPQSPVQQSLDLSRLLESVEGIRSQVREGVPQPLGSEQIAEAVQVAIASHNLPDQIRASLAGVVKRDEVTAAIDEALAKQNLAITQNRTADAEESAILLELLQKNAEALTRAAEEAEARKYAERREAEAARLLRLAEEELDLIKAASRDSVDARVVEAESTSADLREKLGTLMEESVALKATLEEYRMSHSDLKGRLDDVAREKEKMAAVLATLKVQTDEAVRTREIMRERIEKVQADATSVASKMADEKSRWHRAEADLRTRFEIARSQAEAESRTRERFETEMRRLEVQEREAMKLRTVLDHYEQERTQLKSQLDTLLANEHGSARDVVKLRTELESVRLDADASKARYELILEREADAKREAIQDVMESKATALLEQRQAFDERLEDVRRQHRRELDHELESRNQRETFLREANAQRLSDMEQQHQRAIDQALEDKERVQGRSSEQLRLANSKIELLEDKIAHMEQKLEVTRSAAAHAAAAAQSAKAPTVPLLASPVMRNEGGISAQALRESINVLQQQLEEREVRIEKLETSLAAVDRTLPDKLKARDTEVAWLQELLNLRVADLSELAALLSRPDFDRDAVRNAAIRIRATLEMKLSGKERIGGPTVAAAATTSALNLAASLQSFASPRAAPLARVWSEWRSGGGTPARSAASSASSVAGGLMTPPASSLRRTPDPEAQLAAPGTAQRRRESVASSVAASVSERPHRGKDVAVLEEELPRTPRRLLSTAAYDDDAEDGRFSESGFYDDESAESPHSVRGRFDI